MQDPIQTRALLTALADSLDLPAPVAISADERAHHQLLQERTTRAVDAIRFVLDKGHPADDVARWVRERAAARPATYTVWQRGGEQAGR